MTTTVKALLFCASRPQTDPTSIYRVRDGIYAADLLLAAIVHLDLFTWLAENPATAGRDLPRARDHRPADRRDADAVRGDGTGRGARARCFT